MNRDQRIASETIEEIERAIKRGSVLGHNNSAFDEGYKVFIRPAGVYSIAIWYLIQDALAEKNICCEMAIDGAQGTSWAAFGFIVWKGKTE